MPSSYTQTLKLALFSASEDGWAAAMNTNLRRLDSELTTVVETVDGKIDTVESQIASRYQDLQVALQNQTDEYLTRISRAREESFTQLSTYFQAVFQPTLVQFLTDISALQQSVTTQITASETTRQATITAVNDMFTEIDSQFAAIQAQMNEEAAVVTANKEALETLLDAVSAAIDSHANNKNNPHEVTGTQLGDLDDTIVYRADPNDAAYL